MEQACPQIVIVAEPREIIAAFVPPGSVDGSPWGPKGLPAEARETLGWTRVSCVDTPSNRVLD
jgi:hypothetical protein